MRGVVTAIKHFTHLAHLGGGERARATDVLASGLGSAHSGDGALAQHVVFELRDGADVLENGCRVRRFDGVNNETGARAFSAQLWLANGKKPFLDQTFPSPEEREVAIQTVLDTYDNNEPKKPEPPMFLPHHADPVVSFLAALEACG